MDTILVVAGLQLVVDSATLDMTAMQRLDVNITLEL